MHVDRGDHRSLCVDGRMQIICVGRGGDHGLGSVGGDVTGVWRIVGITKVLGVIFYRR